MPELVRAGDPEEPRPSPPIAIAAALQESMRAHDPLHPLAVHRLAQRSAGQGSDHSGAVGRMRLSNLHDLLITRSAGAGTGCRRSTA